MAKARESAGKGRVVRRMNKEEFVSFDRSIPIRNAIVKEDLEEPKDYQIKTDLRIGHDNSWDDVKYCAQVIKACITDDEEYDWGKVGIKIGKNERPRHHKGDEIVIELPDMEFVKKDENDTSGYLVLVSEENVVMPRYYDFITSKLNAFRGEKDLRRAKVHFRKYNKRSGAIYLAIC